MSIDTLTPGRIPGARDPDRLVEAARRHGTPIVDPAGATFVRLGDGPPPPLVGEWADFRSDAALAQTQVVPGVWVARRELPANAYIEYAYLLGGERTSDPLNRWPASDGAGGRVSRLWMPQASREAYLLAYESAAAVPRGRLSRHRLETRRLVAGRTRRVVIYRPANGGTSGLDLLVVLDGQDYMRHQRLHRIADSLIAAGRIRPLALAFVDHGRDARFPELACSDATLAFLVDRVVPFVRRELALDDRPVGIAGPSLGGLMALYAGLRRPHIFGRVLSQSGTFELPDSEMVTSDLVRYLPRRPITVRLSVGTFEWLAGPVARMADLLRARGYDVTHRPFAGGHNHHVWAEDALHGLEALFPPGSDG